MNATKTLEMAIRLYCALAESAVQVEPRTLWSWDATRAALEGSTRSGAALIAEMSGMPRPVRASVMRYTGNFAPLAPTGEVFVFAEATKASAFETQAAAIGARVEGLNGNIVAAHCEDQDAVRSLAASYGGAPYSGHDIGARYESVDTRLPGDMLEEGLSAEMVERVCLRALSPRPLGESRELSISGDAPEAQFAGRLIDFATKRKEIHGVPTPVFEAVVRKGLLTTAQLKALGEADQGTNPGGTAAPSGGAKPAAGGVSNNQPTGNGQPAQSKTEPQKGVATNEVPAKSPDDASAMVGQVTLEDGTVVPEDVLRQAAAKILGNIATQLANNTTTGQPGEPEGDGEEKDGEKPEGEKKDEPGKEAPKGDKAKPDTSDKKSGNEPAGGTTTKDADPKNESVLAFSSAPPIIGTEEVVSESDARAALDKDMRKVGLTGELGRRILQRIARGGAGFDDIMMTVGSRDHAQAAVNKLTDAGWIDYNGHDGFKLHQSGQAAIRESDVTPPKPKSDHPGSCCGGQHESRAAHVLAALREGKSPKDVVRALAPVKMKARPAVAESNHGKRHGRLCEASSDPADVAADALKNFDAWVLKPIRSAVDKVANEGHHQAQAQASVQKMAGSTTAPDHLAGVIKPLKELASEVDEILGHIRKVCVDGHAHIRENAPRVTEGKDDAAKASEQESAAAAIDNAGNAVGTIKSLAFELVTSQLVKLVSIAEAMGMKKSIKVMGKLHEEAKELHDSIKSFMGDFEDAKKAFMSESGAGKAAEAPPPADATPAPVDPAPAPAPVEAAPAPVEAAPASVAVESADPVDVVVSRLVETDIPQRILNGEHIATVLESIRVRSQDIGLTVPQAVQVYDRFNNVLNTRTFEFAIGSAKNHALLAEVAKVRVCDQVVRSLAERTANGARVHVTERELEASIKALRRFGMVEHKLFADELSSRLVATR